MPPRKVAKAELVDLDQARESESDSFSEQLEAELRMLGAGGLNPPSALRFLTRLIVESASADKNRIEKLKMMDKLLNTGRALMETGIRHEETAMILGRLQQLETRLEKLQKKDHTRPSGQ